MAVRFVPLDGGLSADGERPADGGDHSRQSGIASDREARAPRGAREADPVRENLAEVIDLRSRMRVSASLPEAVEPSTAGSSVAGGSVAGATVTERSTFAHAAAEPESTEPATPVRSAHDEGVRLLARRARSSGELRRELVALDHDPHEVEAVIAEFEESLYLDDLGLARITSENLRERKRASRGQIQRKLRDRFLPESVIETVLAELDEDDEQELLRQAVSERVRRLQGLDRTTAERRLLGFLARRGWSGEATTRTAREALDSAGI